MPSLIAKKSFTKNSAINSIGDHLQSWLTQTREGWKTVTSQKPQELFDLDAELQKVTRNTNNESTPTLSSNSNYSPSNETIPKTSSPQTLSTSSSPTVPTSLRRGPVSAQQKAVEDSLTAFQHQVPSALMIGHMTKKGAKRRNWKKRFDYLHLLKH